MNNTTAIFVINDHIRAMLGTYEADTDTHKAKREVFKTFDPDIRVGDLVVVTTSTRHGMAVVKIVEADHDIDVETDAEVRWIIDVIDPAQHEQLQAQENEMLAAVRSAQKKKKRDEMRAALFADQQEKMSQLAIAHVGDSAKAE